MRAWFSVRSLTRFVFLTAVWMMPVVIFSVGCGGGTSPQHATATSAQQLSSSPASALTQVQDAIDHANGYTINVQQQNFVLPRWGGADGGTVEVGAGGTQAQAHLARTGETGATYTILYTGGTTYFQRSTCEQSFQLPGTNVNVLEPYLLQQTRAIAHATNPTIDGSTITATLPGLGQTVIEVDPRTLRPKKITASNSSGPITWTFEKWGAPKLTKLPSPTAERGPGGIPC